MVFLQVASPKGPACPEEDVVLTCTVNTTSMSLPPTMRWQQNSMSSQTTYYHNGAPLSATFGDFNTTAYFSNNNFCIVSNATLYDVMFSHNGISVTCSTPSFVAKETISVAGNNIFEFVYILPFC